MEKTSPPIEISSGESTENEPKSSYDTSSSEEVSHEALPSLPAKVHSTGSAPESSDIESILEETGLLLGDEPISVSSTSIFADVSVSPTFEIHVTAASEKLLVYHVGVTSEETPIDNTAELRDISLPDTSALVLIPEPVLTAGSFPSIIFRPISVDISSIFHPMPQRFDTLASARIFGSILEQALPQSDAKVEIGQARGDSPSAFSATSVGTELTAAASANEPETPSLEMVAVSPAPSVPAVFSDSMVTSTSLQVSSLSSSSTAADSDIWD